MTEHVSDPSELSPRAAWKQYVGTRAPETTQGSQNTYYYRLKLWAEWCEERDIERVGEFSGWIFEQFKNERAASIASTTLRGEMQTLKNHIEFLERIEAVDDGLAERVKVPNVPEGEESSDTKLHTDDALALIQFYRDGADEIYGSKQHALLELAWHTGARLGAIRGLDLRDYDADEEYVSFVHRPETETPLKNKQAGERLVALRPGVCEVVNAYITHHRHWKHDDHGRAPLFTSLQGRASRNSIRVWAYQATLPCQYGPCPHSHDPATCDFTSYNESSKCPSSRSPHQIRTGSITWHRDSGYPREVTSERVNASEDVIDRYYDKATKREELELRRRPHLEKLTIEESQ